MPLDGMVDNRSHSPDASGDAIFFGSSGNSGGLDHEVSPFISLLAQRNEPKKGHPVSPVPPRAGFPEFSSFGYKFRLSRQAAQLSFMPRMGYSSMLPGLCKLGFRSDSANPLFGSLSGARLRANGSLFSPICPAAPRRRGRKKTRELFEGEARVFPRPAPGEKQGKPAGPGLAGVPFSCFFFWARKRRKRKQQKGLATFPGIPG
jgi:hypothetical protein